MRLPFLQLESDLIAHGAAEVAQLAGCHVAQALGHLALLRAWAVSHAGDDAPPDGWVSGDAAGRRIEAAAQWGGERGALLQALLDAGQVQQESGGLRVLHLEPYIIAWNKNAKAKERMRTARERSANTRESGDERSAKFGQQTQTQTQTQTQKEEGTTSSAPVPGPSAPPLVLAPLEAEKPKRAPSPTALGEFIDWARAEVKPLLRPDAPDPAVMQQHQRIRLGEAVKAHGLEALKAAFRMWMGWTVAQEKGYPLGFFAAQWEQWVGQVKAPVAPARRSGSYARAEDSLAVHERAEAEGRLGVVDVSTLRLPGEAP